MIEARVKIKIARPVALVYDYTINPRNASAWYENVKVSDYESKTGAVDVGAKAHLHTNIMGKDYAFTYNIDELIPNQKMLMTTEKGPFPMESEYVFVALDEMNTEVTIINRASPKGVPSFLISMVKGKVEKTIEESASTLKQILESQ